MANTAVPVPKRRYERHYRRTTEKATIRITPQERDLLHDAVVDEGLSMNTIIRKAIRAYAGLPTDLTPTPAELEKTA